MHDEHERQHEHHAEEQRGKRDEQPGAQAFFLFHPHTP